MCPRFMHVVDGTVQANIHQLHERLFALTKTAAMPHLHPSAFRPLRRLRSMRRAAAELQLSGAGAPVRRCRLPLSTPSHHRPFPSFVA